MRMTRQRHICRMSGTASTNGGNPFGTVGRHGLHAAPHHASIALPFRPAFGRAPDRMSKTSLDKSKIKFLLLEGIHPSAVEVLRAAGYTQHRDRLPARLPDAELKARIADVHFLGIRSRTQLTAEVFAAAHKLVAVGCFLHRHQPGRPRRGARARRGGLQRALFQYALGGRTGAGRSDPAAARRAREKRGGASRRLAQVGRQRLRDPRQDAGHRGLRLDRRAAVGAGRGARHAGGLLRRRHQAAAGQCAPGARRCTTCWRRATSSACTCPRRRPRNG